MNTLSVLILTVFILLTGATSTTQDPTSEVTVSVSEVTVEPSMAEDAWDSFDASQITMPASEYELSVSYMRTMDGNFEYSISATEFPVWSVTDPTKVHIFRVAILHRA